MGSYTIHRVSMQGVPPASSTATRKLDHPYGSFASYHPDRLMEHLFASPARWTDAALAVELSIREFERRHGPFASRVGWVLQRSESIGSSTIEDVSPSLRRVARAEAVTRNGEDPYDDPANEAIGNIAATRLAAEIGDAQGPVTLDDLLSIHSTLMDHTSKPEVGGHLRPGWVRIGGVLGGYPPPAYVAPPAEEVPELMDDLLEYINTTNHHPVTAAAVAHVQFESIHPFRDGNGRAGRALVQTILRKGGITRYTTPPISAVLAFNRDQYVDALAASRFEGSAGSPDQVNSLDQWVSLFSSTAEVSCDYAEGLIARIDTVASRWDEKIRSRRGSAARRIVERLPEMPVFSVQSMADLSGTSSASAYRAIEKLTAAGIIAPVRGKHRRSGLYEAPEILDIFKDGSEQDEVFAEAITDLVTAPSLGGAHTKKEKAAEAIRLRRAGNTHRAIGETLGMSTSWAQAVTKGIARGKHPNRSR